MFEFLQTPSFITFDDVLIKPAFSEITSRKDVDLAPLSKFDTFAGLPVMAANMDTVCGVDMAIALGKAGAIPGVLHRFWTIDENVAAVKSVQRAGYDVWCSVGVGPAEFERFKALVSAGVAKIVIDVAHGAQRQVAEHYKMYKEFNNNCFLVVGNFATKESVLDFIEAVGFAPDCIKINIGAGSVCETRIKTGCGVPQLTALLDCSTVGVPMIADGAMKTVGDCAKALAVPNVEALMTGNLLSGTYETPGQVVDKITPNGILKAKSYRGSASKESYSDQNKFATWRTTEGISTLVAVKGSVQEVLQDLEGGLRSALTYVGAKNLADFKRKAKFIRVSSNSKVENTAYVNKI